MDKESSRLNFTPWLIGLALDHWLEHDRHLHDVEATGGIIRVFLELDHCLRDPEVDNNFASGRNNQVEEADYALRSTSLIFIRVINFNFVVFVSYEDRFLRSIIKTSYADYKFV